MKKGLLSLLHKSLFCFLFVFVPYGLSATAGTGEEYLLEDLYRFALERSETIKISEEDLYISQREKDKARSLLFPKLSAFGTHRRYDTERLKVGFTIQPESTNTWGVRMDQSFSISGRELTAFRISKEEIEKSRYDLLAVKEDYLFDVASAYYDVLIAKKAVEINNANVERLTKHRDAAEIRLEVGEATRTTLLRAEAELSGAQSELVRAENNRKFTKVVLTRIVGIDGDYDIKERDGVDREGIEIETIESLKQIALAERVELKAIELQKKIAKKAVGYAKGLYWPTLSVEGVYYREENDPSSSFEVTERIYGGLKLDFPFFEGGLTRAEVREAKAKHRQSELIYEDLKKTISIDVENAYLDFMTQKKFLKFFEDQLAFAGDNYNVVSEQFKYGLANSIDVMDANTLLVTAERELANAEYNYQLSIVKLKRATGILLKTVTSKQSAVISEYTKEK